MKTNYWLILGTMVATSVIAQNSNSLPEIPPPANAPAAEQMTPPPAAPAAPKKKHAAPVKKISEPTVTLNPGPAEVAAPQVNVRGQAGLKGEMITHLVKGDTVNVLEQINLGKHAANEPAQWAKIAYPSKAHVWVSAKYVDPATKTVTSKKLNLRAGPGENFSVLGSLERGATVNPVETKNGWIQIEPPANTYAFVAAMYLKQEGGVAMNNQTPTPTPTPTATEEPTPTPTPNPPTMSTPEQPVQVPLPTIDPNVPRVASHEGVVRHVGSPITPTEYELYSTETDKNIDYLSTSDTNLDLGKYVGMRIVATGEESLSSR
ncbi:MAG TPA: SH3 domain-containing protein, partial [Desulfuromonadaceae bacterium]|nr:SH3 domain-containing protein [Desulfuromonadaceae bacterium]